MTDISVTLDRTSLTLGDLEAGNWSPTASAWLPSTGISWPKFARRKTRAPEPPHIPGPGALLARVAGLGLFPLTIYVAGDTTAEVETAKTEWQAAVDQWTYDLTLEVDGVSQSFTAECAEDEIDWGEIESGMVRAHICRGTVAIPLYP